MRHAQTDAPRPKDLVAVELVAELLDRSRRTVDRWSSDTEQLPKKIPRYSVDALDGTTRTLLSWTDVLRYCAMHNKKVPDSARTFDPLADA